MLGGRTGADPRTVLPDVDVNEWVAVNCESVLAFSRKRPLELALKGVRSQWSTSSTISTSSTRS